MHKRRSGQNINKRSIANGQCSNRRHPLLPLCRWTEIQKHVAPVANKQIWACVNEKQVPQVEASLPIVPKSCKEEVHGCSIYAKLSLRNDGPGDGALLSRRGSSASGWITPELSLSLPLSLFVEGREEKGWEAGRERKEKKGKMESFLSLTGLIPFQTWSCLFFRRFDSFWIILHSNHRFYISNNGSFFFFSFSLVRPIVPFFNCNKSYLCCSELIEFLSRH